MKHEHFTNVAIYGNMKISVYIRKCIFRLFLQKCEISSKETAVAHPGIILLVEEGGHKRENGGVWPLHPPLTLIGHGKSGNCHGFSLWQSVWKPAVCN